LLANISTYEDADNAFNYIVIKEEGSSAALLHLENPSEINSIDFSPDGKKIAAATEDKKVRVWNIENIFDTQIIEDLECSNIFDDHSDEVLMAFFSPNGNHIVSIDKSNEIRIWNLQYDGCIFKYACQYKVEFATFSSDGTQLYIVDSNKRVEVLQFPQLEDLIEQQRLTCQNRNFTQEERKKYYLD
jgi:WD40 repeat protein